MIQDRLSNLCTLSMENKIAEDLDFTELINDFVSKKARKVQL